MWLNSMFISHEDVGCLYLHLKLHLRGEPSQPRSPPGGRVPLINLKQEKTWLLEGQ